MKGIDTNVLVRYLVQDDPTQARKATHFIERKCTLENPCLIGPIVLAELVWVLESNYQQSREDISSIIEQLLEVDEVEIMDSGIVWKSLRDYRGSNVDFSDHLLARTNEARGCAATVTFDKKAGKQPAFELLG